LWRAKERLAPHRRAPNGRRNDEGAITAAVAALRRYHTVDDWLQPRCRLPGGRVLNSGIVEDWGPLGAAGADGSNCSPSKRGD
jgi:hypothetical protein